jgi:hypothetical protein
MPSWWAELWWAELWWVVPSLLVSSLPVSSLPVSSLLVSSLPKRGSGGSTEPDTARRCATGPNIECRPERVRPV